MKNILTAAIVIVLGSAAASAAPVTFFGEDLTTGDPNIGSLVNAFNARNTFLVIWSALVRRRLKATHPPQLRCLLALLAQPILSAAPCGRGTTAPADFRFPEPNIYMQEPTISL